MKPSMDKETPAETAEETVMEMGEMEYVEYVSDEDWDTMVHVYKIIMDNYGTAQGLVAAEELIEYGKACERDGLTAEEAGEKLREMVDTADGMLGLIRQGGGPVVEIPAAGGTDAEEAGVDAGTGEAAFEGAENVGEDEGM